jgi:hypothetical protein
MRGAARSETDNKAVVSLAKEPVAFAAAGPEGARPTDQRDRHLNSGGGAVCRGIRMI